MDSQEFFRDFAKKIFFYAIKSLNLAFFVHFFLTFFVFFLFKFLIYRWIPLITNGEIYGSSSILLSALSYPRVVGLFLFASGIPLLGINKISWKNFPSIIRVFFLFVGGLLAWFLCTYDYNFFLNQWYVYDRLFLFASYLLLIINPAFTGLFYFLVWLYLSLFNFGPHQLDLVHFLPPLVILAALTVYVPLKSWFKVHYRVFILTLLTVIGGQYFYQGILKASFGEHVLQWALTYDLSFGMSWAQFQGWQWFLSPDTKVLLHKVLEIFNRPLILILFFMEIIALFICFSKRFSYFILFFFIVFHLSVFFVSGVLFWIWISVNFATILLLRFIPSYETSKLFTISNCIMSVIFVLFLSTSGFFNRELIWWNTRYHYRISIKGITKTNEEHILGKTIFSPYHVTLQFVFNKQDYLIKEPILPSVPRNHRLFQTINRVLQKNSENRLNSLKLKSGRVPFDAKKTLRFKKFVNIFLNNYKETDREALHYLSYLRKIQPPLFYYTNYRPDSEDSYSLIQNIKTIEIYLQEGVFQENKNTVLSNTHQHSISIP